VKSTFSNEDGSLALHVDNFVVEVLQCECPSRPSDSSFFRDVDALSPLELRAGLPEDHAYNLYYAALAQAELPMSVHQR